MGNGQWAMGDGRWAMGDQVTPHCHRQSAIRIANERILPERFLLDTNPGAQQGGEDEEGGYAAERRLR